jgi:ribonuclease G
MSRNTLVINCDLRETRVCLIEDGVIAELHLERSLHRGTVGNIVLGRVTRVLPGMQAAFIDIGMERAAFLHVEDLIRPDDFEAYLDKGDRREDEPSGKGDGHRRFAGGATSSDIEDDDDESGSAEDWSDEKDSGSEVIVRSRLDDNEIVSEPELEQAGLVVASDEGESQTPVDSDIEEDDEDEGQASVDVDIEEGDEDEGQASVDSDIEEDDEDEGQASVDSDVGEDDEERGDADERDDEVVVENAVALEADDDDSEFEDEDEFSSEDAIPIPVSCESEETVPASSEGNVPTAESVRESVDVLPPQAIADSRSRDGRGRRRRRRRRRNGEPSGQVSAVAGASNVTAESQANVNASRAPSETGRGVSSVNGRAVGKPSTRNRTRDNVGRDNSGRDVNRAARSKTPLSRVSRSVPITEIVKEGNEVVVQISKEPIGTKGARVTSHVSLPGRHVVYLPTVDHVGISKRIGSPKERNRLRQVIDALKPQNGGLIVRTLGEGLTKKALKTDIGYLIALWKEVSRKKAAAKAPTVLYTELDLVLKTARDLFTDDVEKIIIDDRDQYARIVQFLEMFLPARVKDVELYSGDEPIFDAYGIEDEIGRALGRKVPLPSGGYLVIDQAEALTAIDVNTGRFVGKGSKDLEETAYKTNIEAVTEIAYQLRLRNIGGLVILDLIDMDYASNREKVWRALEQHLAKDKAKTTINRISDLGLIEMTRKRTRESLTRMLHEPCFYCDGTGQIQSRVTVAYEILRQVRRERHLLKGYSIVVNAHPAVIDLLQNEEKAAVQETERRYLRRLELVPRREYHLEQFDLLGK